METYQMKTSELIQKLHEKLEANGDLPVRFVEDENTFDDKGSSMPCGAVVSIMGTDENGNEKAFYEVIMTSVSAAEME